MSGSLLFLVYPTVTASVRFPRIQPRQTTGLGILPLPLIDSGALGSANNSYNILNSGIPVIRALHSHYSRAWGSIPRQKTKIPQVTWFGQEWDIYVYDSYYVPNVGKPASFNSPENPMK